MPSSDVHEEMLREVATKEGRKIRAREEGVESACFGLGMFGMVGWSVAVPTLVGVAIGLWIDGRWPSRYSWTLMFLLGGMVLGCFNAWWWISREREQIDRHPDADDR